MTSGTSELSRPTLVVSRCRKTHRRLSSGERLSRATSRWRWILILPLKGSITLMKLLIASAHDHTAVLEHLRTHDRPDGIAGVITQAARGCIPAAAKVSEALGLRHLNCAAADLSLQKRQLTQLLNPRAKLVLFDEPGNLESIREFPCVLKVEGTSGGDGVHLVRQRADLERLIPTLPDDRPVFVERYVRGRHFGVIGLMYRGDVKVYGIAEKFLLADLRLDKVVFPADLDPEIERDLKAYSTRVLNEIGFDFGPFQLELVLDEKLDPFFVELEASVLGSYISELMIPSTSDNDMISDTIDLVCEGRFDPDPPPPFLHSVLKYHFAKRGGTLGSFSLAEVDRRILFKPYFNSGDPIPDSRMYVANSFIVGRDLDEIQALVDAQTIEVDFRS